MPPSPEELTLLLGPPADARMRALFDRLQESIKAGHSQEAAVCERIQAEYFGDLFRPEAGRPSIMDELLSAVLGLAVRIRRHELRLGLARGAWVPCLTLACRDLEADDRASLRFPPTDDGARDMLAASIGKALGLDWVIAFTH